MPTVAQPLTEAEVAEELAVGRRAEEQRHQAKEAKRANKEARRETARAARATAKALVASARATGSAATLSAGPSTAHVVRRVNGRLMGSFNTVIWLVAGAAVCVLMLTTYSLGRRSAEGQDKSGLAPAAAVKKPAEFSATPLLPALGKPMSRASKPEGPPPSPDLSRLLDKPRVAQQESGVAANSPAKPAQEEPVDEAAAAKLNHLQIESFLITRERSGDVVVSDLEDARRFLEERGVKTIARRHSNGYVLYSEQGFSLDRESAKQREAFRRRIEALGQEYRRSGGQYEFKGCNFVGHAKTKAGRPV